jgi:hypothetical protein
MTARRRGRPALPKGLSQAKHLTARVSPKLARDIARIAEEEGVTDAALMRESVIRYCAPRLAAARRAK